MTGDWDPSPSGLQFLLKEVSSATSGEVSYRRSPIQLEQSDLSRYPFLYITGHLDFRFSDAAATNLKNYLERGGFLLASNCCDSRAIRHGRCGANSSACCRTKASRWCRRRTRSTLRVLRLTASRPGCGWRGIERDGAWSVIYSPLSIGTAWDREERPFVALPEPSAARKLGINILVYSMTH